MSGAYHLRTRGAATLFASLLLALAVASACGTRREDNQANPDPVARGRGLFIELGCGACHVTGRGVADRRLGPPLTGLYGREIQLADGRMVRVDDAYLRESIAQPDAAIVAGYSPGIMAAGLGSTRVRLEEADAVAALVAYIRSLE